MAFSTHAAHEKLNDLCGKHSVEADEKAIELINEIATNNSLDYKNTKEDHEGNSYSLPTNLMHACGSARPTIVKALIEKGAGLNFLDNTGNSALVSAVCGDNMECVKLLVEAGIELDHCRNEMR